MNIKRFVGYTLFAMALLFCSCLAPACAPELATPMITPSPSPAMITPSPSPTITPHATISIDFADTDELEKFLKRLKVDKSSDPFGNISSEKYFKLEKIPPNPSSMNISINLSLLMYYYMYPDLPVEYSQNVIGFAWYRDFTDGKDFLRNIWSEGLTYEEVKHNGILYLYRKAKAPIGKNGEEIDAFQYAHWAQGNDCFSCFFPLSISKEEFLDYCKAVCVKIE